MRARLEYLEKYPSEDDSVDIAGDSGEEYGESTDTVVVMMIDNKKTKKY